MTQKNRVQVRIADTDYTLVGTESFEYMQKLAHTVDHQMREMMKCNRHLTPAMAAVLSALNAQNEKHRMEEASKSLSEDMIKYRSELDKLHQDRKRMSEDVETLRKEVAALKIDLARAESEAGRKYGQNGRKVNIG